MSSPIAEKDLQAGVIQLARLLGYRVAHFRPAQTSKGWRTPVMADGKGFPDLVMAHAERRRLIFAELKRTGGKLTVEQEGWRDTLTRIMRGTALVEYHVWTPADWPDRVTEVLSGLEVSVTVA